MQQPQSASVGRVSRGLVSFWGANRTAVLGAIALLAFCTAFPASLKAACGPSLDGKVAMVLPGSLFHPQLLPAPRAGGHAGRKSEEGNGSIVGLWHVNYTDSSGNPFLESFDMWHADGTEWETANGDPRQGNYCLGVWKQVGRRTVQLNHIGWAFNPDGSSAGYFTLVETNTVSRQGDTYTGTFDMKTYDVNGNLTGEYTGTMLAKRITV